VKRDGPLARVVGAGVGAVVLLAPQSAAASELGYVANVGPMYSHSWGDLTSNGFGAEAAIAVYPDPHRTVWHVGAFTQGQVYLPAAGDDTPAFGRVAAGFQGGWAGFGAEVGWSYRSPSSGLAGVHGIHIAPFISGMFLWIAPRFTFPLSPDRGVEYGFSVGFKYPFLISKTKFDAYPFPVFRPGSGRALRSGGRAALGASIARGSEWRWGRSPPDVGGIDWKTRRALASLWVHDGRLEHASVAAFARLSLELMALGAPPELVEGAHKAALDEARHARVCFALASAYAGEAIDPDGLPEAVLPLDAPDFARLAAECVVDGCFGEAVGAAAAREGSRRVRDPAVKRALAAIAREEARHAALAWRILGFCLERGGARAAEAAAGAVGRCVMAAVGANEEIPSALRAHGRVGAEVMASIERRVRRAVARRLPSEAYPGPARARELRDPQLLAGDADSCALRPSGATLFIGCLAQ
jgi:hypothetical protein